MILSISLRRLIAKIRDFQDDQSCGILADTAEIDLASQPLPDQSAACLASSDLTTRSGKGT